MSSVILSTYLVRANVSKFLMNNFVQKIENLYGKDCHLSCPIVLTPTNWKNFSHSQVIQGRVQGPKILHSPNNQRFVKVFHDSILTFAVQKVRGG